MLANLLVCCSPPQQERQSFRSQTGSHVCHCNPHRSFASQADPSDTDYSDRMNDRIAQQHRAVAMPETVYVPGCTCNFCSTHPEIDDDADLGYAPPRSRSQNYADNSLPSTRSIVQVLYPPSYLGTPRPFPDPPSYSLSDFPPYPARGDDPEIPTSISSTTASIEGTPMSRSFPDPLSQDPSLTGVPSQGIPSSRISPVEPNPPIIALGGDVLEESEPLPAYSRFDQRRPRLPAASRDLGPYPPLSVLCRAVR